MKNVSAHIVRFAVCALCLSINIAQAQTQASTTDGAARDRAQAAEFKSLALLAQSRPIRRAGFSMMSPNRYAATAGPLFAVMPMAAGPILPVTGSGALGHLTKWAGFTSINATIDNSSIFEDKFGLVGIGTESPTSKLTVFGLIESTGAGGGVKYPDATIQTTAFDPNQVVRSLNGLRGDLTVAAGTNITVTPSGGKTLTIAAPNVLTFVSHNATLIGNGTVASQLSIADGGVATAQLANAAVTAGKIASGQVLKGLNGLTDQVTLVAGPNITLTANGNSLTIAAPSTDSAISAFQKGLLIDLPDDGTPNFQDFEIQIPANKRLVIECLTLDMFADNGARIFFSVTTHIGSGENVEHNFPPIRVKERGFATNQQVRIYADGSVAVHILRLESGGEPAFGKISISGHLVDLP